MGSDSIDPHIPENSLNEIRDATDKARVLGNDRFKQRYSNWRGESARMQEAEIENLKTSGSIESDPVDSVMEAQLSNLECIALDAIYHAMLICYAARPEA